MPKCDRCGSSTNSTIMSMFNTDNLCMPCKDEEMLMPGYVEASKAEIEQVRQGNYNFLGVGLPPKE